MRDYQHNFSGMHREIYYDEQSRLRKAAKMLEIVRDSLNADLHQMDVLDVGCSTGAMCRILSEHFGSVTGIDIDREAINFAMQNSYEGRIRFQNSDAMATGFAPESFDVVICAHIYEHVPDPERMMGEIHRILRKGGVCYFAAENRLVFREGDYGLPFLSILPRPLANLYIRVAGKAESYYERLYTIWGLRRLVKDFKLVDYTALAVHDPERFFLDDMLPKNSIKQKVASIVVRFFYWLFPNYLWILRKQ